MAQKVASFNELTQFIQSFGIEETDAIHIAESFMDANSIDFDDDGNFSSINVDFSKDSKTVNKC
ncbi:MAG: hypothetical protein JXR70_17845 [Spirochaetales bacterium]|nr:hypothetical protein [Spirochaetales bacterium]